jgi:signal transduction histidine kinase
MTIRGSRGSLHLPRQSRIDPTVLRRVVDVTCATLAVALFLRLDDPEILLQALWLTVAIGAFMYGLQAALARIAIAAAAMIGFIWLSSAVGVPPSAELLEFTEWPLMVTIAVIVAVLADRLSTSARRYAALYRQASERLVTAQEEERARLARDLHDGVGQVLTAVVLTLDAAESEIQANSDPLTFAGLTSIQRARELASTALAETREVAAQLRPTRVHEIGLGAALHNLAGSAGVAIDLRFRPEFLPPGILEPEREIDMYRIVQEAVGNAARHSHASTIWIAGRTVDGKVRLVIGDDGVGFDVGDRGRGLGLDGMHERAAIHGGSVNVRSTRGVGTRVEIIVPLSHRDAEPAVIAPNPAIDIPR